MVEPERRHAMKYVVDQDVCIGCGLCESTCPTVFSLNADGKAVAEDREVEAAEESSAAEAKENCPVGAISEA